MQYRYDEKGRLYTISRPGISDEVKSAASNTQLYRSTEGLKFREYVLPPFGFPLSSPCR